MKRERQLALHRPDLALLDGIEEVLCRRKYSVRSPCAGRCRWPPGASAANTAPLSTQSEAKETLYDDKCDNSVSEAANDHLNGVISELPDVFGRVLYDLARVMQRDSSTYDAFDVLYRAVSKVRQRENAVKTIKHYRRKKELPVNIYHQLLSRRMGRRGVEQHIVSRQLRRVSVSIKRAINVWGHHCCLDEIDPNKPYNEPPQVRCIRFDRTGEVIITGGDEGIIKLWHTFNCTLITSLRKHAGGIVSLDVHPNNFFLLSCCDGGELWLWEINGNLHRAHKRISSPFKYLWCRFLSSGANVDCKPSGFSDRCSQEIENTLVVCVTTDSKLSIYRMSDLVVSSSGSNIICDVAPLYTVELFNHYIKAYDISRPLMYDNSSLIAVGIEPMFLEELRMSDDAVSSALMLLNKEPNYVTGGNVPGKYGEISTNALCALFNVSTGELLRVNGKDSLADGNSERDLEGVCPVRSKDMDRSAVSHNSDDYCVCDANMAIAMDSASKCKYCLKRVRTFTFPPVPRAGSGGHSSLLDGSLGYSCSSENGRLPTSSRSLAPNFIWNSNSSKFEKHIRDALGSYSLEGDISVVDSVNIGENSMPFGRMSSRLVFPSYMEHRYASLDGVNRDPGNFDDLIYHVQRGHDLSPDVCFANSSLNHVTGSDDGKLFLWVHCGHDVRFKSKQLFTKCLTKWLSSSDSQPDHTTGPPTVMDPSFLFKSHDCNINSPRSVPSASVKCDNSSSEGLDGADRGFGRENRLMQSHPTTVSHKGGLKSSELNLSDSNLLTKHDGNIPTHEKQTSDVSKVTGTSLNSTLYSSDVDKIDFRHIDSGVSYASNESSTSFERKLKHLDGVDAFSTSASIRPSMMDDCVKERVTVTSELFKEGEVNKQCMSESGHHYVVTAISWSLNDTYIFIADSIVTRYNVKKLITASRTILSGVSVFTSDGVHVADFLHNDISHHVGCVKPHPVTDDLLLTITYGGIIYVLSVESKSVVKKLDCGPNAVWVDADWHPSGMYFAACQSYGCFSLFALDGLVSNYSSTLNHQSGYSDMLPINTSAFYTGAESNAEVMRRYYYGSTLMPALELPGKGSNENLRLYTASSMHTILDDNRCEVLYACSPVPMQVDDTQLSMNRLSEMFSIPDDIVPMISVLSRMPLSVGIVEFLQWHLANYLGCEIIELIVWFMCLYGVEKIVDLSKRIRRSTCPYGGSTCMVCHYISTATERAERYASIISGHRGVKSRVNERGDIIACLPISARPQSAAVPQTTSTSFERRTFPVSPVRRTTSTTTTSRLHSTVRSHVGMRSHHGSRASTRPHITTRPQPTRVQPPRGRAAQTVTAPATPDTVTLSDNEEQSQGSPRRGLGGTSASSSSIQRSTRTPSADERIGSTRSPNDPAARNTPSRVKSDERTARRLRREMRIYGSSEDDSTPERATTGYALRQRRGGGYIDHARHISTMLGPLGLSRQGRRDGTTSEGICVMCGHGDDSHRSKRGSGQRVYIGGSKITKNALVGPFATSPHYLEVLGEELPRVYDRLGSSVVIHTGCLAAATYLLFDTAERKVSNLPEVLTRGMHLKCSYCDDNFATLHCNGPNCSRVFHYPCAFLCLDDESYQQRQPTAYSNPAILERISNFVDPLLCDQFYCVECTLKSCMDGSLSLEPLCTGDFFLRDDSRAWFYSDTKNDLQPFYIPQGGELVIVPRQEQGVLKANITSFWSFQTFSQMLEVKKMDYRFYGPVSDNFGVCSVMSLRQVDNNRRISLFYYPGAVIVLPVIDLLVGLWRFGNLDVGSHVKVRYSGEWKDAVVCDLKRSWRLSSPHNIVVGDFSTNNVGKMAQVAFDIGTNCIKVEPISGITKEWFSSWDVHLGTESETILLDKLKESLFPADAKAQLLNLTLDAEFEDFNVLPTFEESREHWVRIYWQTVSNPMSLEKVRQRILNSYYTCPQGCISDLELIVRNCEFFNPPSSEICQLAHALERAVSTVRDNIRRLMNTDRYCKILCQTVFPDIERFFVDTGDNATEVGSTSVSSPVRPERGSVSEDHGTMADEDVPIRPSKRPLHVDSTLSSESTTVGERHKEEVTHATVVAGSEYDILPRRSTRRSARNVVSYKQTQRHSADHYSPKSRNVPTRRGSTRHAKSSGSSQVDTRSKKDTATTVQLPNAESRRSSARLAAIIQHEREHAKQLELEAEREAQEAKLRRLMESRYNFRNRG
ncbi:uncharacterized protein BXIN_0192 [Babesia sp. Xinjiang]|uniref:uncharacterized protein n=1 Tax=Babesia sp. Xinjiang TaxID=462227 RepID=UPI000A21BD69|nr:uncharacterized protein BXIN_0192 [Babesia sp. Xinjiang]ORM39836.1 hypothetical protein BXIN_0192 [Babesia sp. Xinjiang]